MKIRCARCKRMVDPEKEITGESGLYNPHEELILCGAMLASRGRRN